MADLLLGCTDFRQGTEGLSQFDRVQIAALDILDQSESQSVVGIDLRYDGRNARETRLAGRAPSSFANDQFESFPNPPHHDGLNHTVLPNRIGQGLELGGLEDAAWLVGVRIDPIDGNLGRSRLG